MKHFSSGGGSKAICSSSEAWKYVITKTDGPDAGKAYYNCGESCTCIIGGDVTVKEQEKLGPSEAYCECGEGWSCVVTKIEDPNAGKAFVECADGCTSVTKA